MGSLSRKIKRAKPSNVSYKGNSPEETILTEEEFDVIWNEIAKQYNRAVMPKIAATMNNFQQKVDQQMMVMACKIIYENYGKLKNKEKRIKNFIDLYNEEMRQWQKLSGEEQYKKIDEEIERISAIAGEKLVWNWERKGEKDGV